jgi:hypothetical protein
MALVVENAPLPSTGGDEQLSFRPQDRLELVIIDTAGATVIICIGEAKGGGKIAFNQTTAVTSGENRVKLGSFKANPYVVRIAADNVLVKNIAFTVK